MRGNCCWGECEVSGDALICACAEELRQVMAMNIAKSWWRRTFIAG
jgi:hypothetical protein